MAIEKRGKFLAKPLTKRGKWVVRLRDLQTLKLIRKFNKCKSLLEVGPGRGTFGELCVSEGIGYEAIDANHNVVEQSKEKVLTISKVLFPYCVPDDTFDVFLARAVLEHVDGPKQANDFIEGAITCIRPGGVLFIETPDIRYY